MRQLEGMLEQDGTFENGQFRRSFRFSFGNGGTAAPTPESVTLSIRI